MSWLDEEVKERINNLEGLTNVLNTNIVWQPGGPGGANVHTTFAAAYATMEAKRGKGRMVLEVDNRYTAPVPAQIPAGIWNFSGTSITGPTTFADLDADNPPKLEFMDGCSIIMDGPEPGADQEWLQFRGDFLNVIFNGRFAGLGPNQGGTGITPLLGINVIFLGSTTFIGNTDEFAAPMMKSVGFMGSVVMNGTYNSLGLLVFSNPAESPAPVWDINSGSVGVECAGGNIYDNAITDSVGGGNITLHLTSDSALGGGTGIEFGEDGVAPTYEWPGLSLVNGSIVNMKPHHRDRYALRSSVLGAALGFPPGAVEFAASPYAAAYNELIICDTTAGVIQVTAPRAYPAAGDRVTIKNVAGANNVTLAPSPTGLPGPFPPSDFVEAGTDTVVPGQTKTWVTDGRLTWVLVSST